MDVPNRKMILKNALPNFIATLDHIDTLQSWRNGSYTPLLTEPANVYQAFTIVKLVYTSSRYTSSQRIDIYEDQKAKTPGNTALLTFNTVTALDIPDINDF